MSQFDLLWRKWLSITFGFTVLLGVLSMGFISYQGASSSSESRSTLRQLLYTHLEKESPRIADELYLRLESLDQRQQMLNELIGHYGSVRIKFDRSDNGKKEPDFSDHASWKELEGNSNLLLPIRFGDLYIGDLSAEVKWASVWTFPSFRRNLLVSSLMVALIIGLWAIISVLMRKRVFLPAMQEFKDKSSQEAFSKIASQVAHDIRSPLADLAMVEKDLSTLPEETRIMLRSAVGRIRDISNHLLEQNRIAGLSRRAIENNSNIREESSSQLLSSVLESILTEKRMQYRSKLGLEIEFQLSPEGYGIFAEIQLVEFKRVISNLINNAVEALPGMGKVSIGLSGPGDLVEITVSDNGKGISTEILGRLTQLGETHGKAGGSGLGLFHARSTFEAWGGSLSLLSQVGVGTTVVLKLPRAKPPGWFVERLKLAIPSIVVVLDDDQTIHRIWLGRLESVRAVEHGVELVHLSTPAELRAWSLSGKKGEAVRYLIDFELLGFTETGLDLIDELGIAAQSILVTSRYEEASIRQRCSQLNVSLIPKGMAGFVPIEISKPKEKWDAVLLDDDVLVGMTWKMAAKRSGKRLQVHSSLESLRRSIEKIELSTPIYLDSDLGHGLRGEELGLALHHEGFTELYLATGYEAHRFEPQSWLKGVIGKEPPLAWS